MKGDFTRFTFDSAKHYTRVLKQQGRVDVDADWNEAGEISDYLDRQTRIDVIGRVGVAAHPTFTITDAPPNLTLSPARFYVDGIFVDYPGEVINLPAAPNTVDQLFLDVWERHITAIEDPEIREVALGGPDTCTRVRTEVAVRVRRGVAAGTTCETATLPPASTGTLTAAVEPTPPSNDPCLIAPNGGYRGLENRLYRVEIHGPGALGTATFKWSRDNGSVVFAVTEFPAAFPNRVRVSRLGRDQVLGFRPGDWVEILGDQNELTRDNPGQLRQVTNINEADRELVLSAAVVAVPMGEHPRVRRWDQTSNAIATGAGPFDLEDGIQVSFAGTGTPSDFHTGDYWVFAARAATGTIEAPAPQPSGIAHHYAKLAIVTWPPVGPPLIEICIPEFPPLTELRDGCCCCTVKVAPQGGDFTDIQAAVNSHPGEPLIVCIEPGEYSLSAPVQVNRNNITIRGCGRLTLVGTTAGVVTAFAVSRRTDVRIESLDIRGGDWSITSQASEFDVTDCRISRGGIWIGRRSQDVRILRNDIGNVAGPGIALGGIPPGGEGGGFGDQTGRIRISANRISLAGEAGIASVIGEDAAALGIVENVEISDNWISRCARSARLTGFAVPQVPVTGGTALFLVNGLSIRDNLIEDCGREDIPASGIGAVGCSDVQIEGNLIRRNGTRDPGPTRTCVDFRPRGGEVLTSPFVESGVRFVNMTANGTVLTSMQVVVPVVVGGATFGQVGLSAGGRGRIEITLPNGGRNVSIRVFHIADPTGAASAMNVVFFAGSSQVSSQAVPLNQSVVLAAPLPDITRILVVGSAPGDVVQEVCFDSPGVPATSYQAGIFAYLTLATPNGGAAALAIRGNSVATPAGQSILAVALGEVAVHDNHLDSADGRVQPGAASQVGISLIIAAIDLEGGRVPDSAIVFNGNQVTSRIQNFPASRSTGSRCWLFSTVDLGMEGNRFQQPDRNSLPVNANVVVGLAVVNDNFLARSIRVNGNRFFEWRDEFSLLAIARSVIAVGNHHAHVMAVPVGPTHASVANVQFFL